MSNLRKVGVGAVVLVGLYALANVIFWAYVALVPPLKVETERVQPVNEVNICREVESGALDARTINSCPPKLNLSPMTVVQANSRILQPFSEDDDHRASEVVQPASVELRL